MEKVEKLLLTAFLHFVDSLHHCHLAVKSCWLFGWLTCIFTHMFVPALFDMLAYVDKLCLDMRENVFTFVYTKIWPCIDTDDLFFYFKVRAHVAGP